MRYSTNVLINERDSLRDFDRVGSLHQSYLVADVSHITRVDESQMARDVEDSVLD